MLNKIIKATSLMIVASLAASAAAGTDRGPTVTVGGHVDTQFGSQHQKRYFDLATNSGLKSDRYGLVNDTQIHFKIDGHSHGLKYGGLINLNADTSESKVGERSIAHQTMAYVESAMGRLEAGSYTGAYEAMRVSGATLARATGGIDGDWKYWSNNNVLTKRFSLVSPSLPTAMDKSYISNASKVTIYTPSANGLKAGVSFIPDTDQHGTVTNLKNTARSFTKSAAVEFTNGQGFKNVVQGGFMYNGKLDKLNVKASVLGEIGSAKKYYGNVTFPAQGNNPSTTQTATTTREKLRAFEAGASVHFMGFGVGGSYGNTGRSGAPKFSVSETNANTTYSAKTKKGRFYTGGVNYDHSQFGASFGYMNSRASRSVADPKANFNVYSGGIDLKSAPGFMPYAEVTYFNEKIGHSATTPARPNHNRGTIILAGMKLNF